MTRFPLSCSRVPVRHRCRPKSKTGAPAFKNESRRLSFSTWGDTYAFGNVSRSHARVNRDSEIASAAVRPQLRRLPGLSASVIPRGSSTRSQLVVPPLPRVFTTTVHDTTSDVPVVTFFHPFVLSNAIIDHLFSHLSIRFSPYRLNSF